MGAYGPAVIGLVFAVDLLLLRMTGPDGSLCRQLLAASLGGAFAVACLRWPALGAPILLVVSLAAVAAAAFAGQPGWLRRCGAFCFLWLSLSGMAIGISGKSLWFPVLAASLLALLALTGGNGSRRLLSVRIDHEGRSVSLTALTDTGNLLRDPVSGEPVLVAPPQAGLALLGLNGSQLSDPAQTLLSGRISGLRLIPYNTVGQQSGLLLARRFSDVTVDGRQQSRIVAFSPTPIGAGAGFDALAGGIQ